MSSAPDTLAAAIRAGDLARLGDLLAPDVRWLGLQAGTCFGRDEVLELVGRLLDSGVELEPTESVEVGDRVLLHIALSSDEQTRGVIVLTLDRDGLVVHLQDYADPERARADLELRAAGTETEPEHAVSGLIPFVGVADVERSLAFYRLLGFLVQETYEPDDELVWALLHSGEARLMLALGGPVDPRPQGVLFYLYAHDLPVLREQLIAGGALAGEIHDGSPGPRQELRVLDPDGYTVVVAQIEE